MSATLNAAFPNAMPSATFALYVSEVERLEDAQAVQEAIIGLIRTCSWLPKLAELHEAYRQTARTFAHLREARRREEAAQFALTHGLPRGDEREAIPPRTIEWLRGRGIDVDGLLKTIDEGGRP